MQITHQLLIEIEVFSVKLIFSYSW